MAKKKEAKWQEWGGQNGTVKIGKRDLEKVDTECELFDVRHPNGNVMVGCSLNYGYRLAEIRGCTEFHYFIHAINQNGWTVVVPKDALLRKNVEATTKVKETALKGKRQELLDQLAQIDAELSQ